MQVFSDLQLGDGNGGASALWNALADNYYIGASRTIVDGDLTEWSSQDEYDWLKGIIQSAGYSLDDFAFAAGNHELRTTEGESFDTLVNRFMSNFGTGMYFEKELAGQDIIVLGSDIQPDCWAGAHFSDEELAWLRDRLAYNASIGRTSYVIVHQPIENTVNGSYTGQWGVSDGCGIENMSELSSILNDYSNVIVFTGHTHYSEQVSSVYRADSSHPLYVNTAAMAYLQSNDNDSYDGSQGWYVYVYTDKIVLKGYDFANNGWTGISYTFSLG